MQDAKESGHTGQWLDDNRHHVRWREANTALLQWNDSEHLVKTRDFSLGGAGLRTEGSCPPPAHQRARLIVVFQSGIREFPAELVYARRSQAECRLGVRWGEMQQHQLDFLHTRYSPSARGLGSVK